jgi:hypothetical protein
MSHQLINLSQDLKRLRDEEYEVAIKGNYLIISGVPYVTSNKKIAYGTLVSELTISGNKTAKPGTHVVHFAGEHPCYSNGSILEPIRHSSGRKLLIEGVEIDHMFSNKPATGYKDYHEKMTRYIMILENEAKAIDDSVTARTGKLPVSDNEDPVFHYPDTNSSRAEIMMVADKLRGQNVAIIGLGGTGSYILDFVAKTPVAEIHLFDEDKFLVHNAYRTPGAPTREELNELSPKVEYLHQIYSKMHRGVIPHKEHISEANIESLTNMNFVFVCVDKGKVKSILLEFLEKQNIAFTDVGIGLVLVEEQHSLIGQIRTTTSTPDRRDHIREKALFSLEEENDENEYSRNIQIAELNALNAAMAVIKWKKLSGFYQDLVREHHTVFSINDNSLSHEDEA